MMCHLFQMTRIIAMVVAEQLCVVDDLVPYHGPVLVLIKRSPQDPFLLLVSLYGVHSVDPFPRNHSDTDVNRGVEDLTQLRDPDVGDIGDEEGDLKIDNEEVEQCEQHHRSVENVRSLRDGIDHNQPRVNRRQRNTQQVSECR
ncbi:hypothetical protein WICPIJ_005571 [Wickerhamomyces pijperi]|uniref:Uncharacterized protein n=1 Tax=Wickerhamomyces pijperi TaxID=599730 RepID=A0A9P8Q3S0_WICPI|nr:hypothetical protein WICPIJ_005571 [Wickerhamomyces pijperi]